MRSKAYEFSRWVSVEMCPIKPGLKKHRSDRTANVKIYFVEYASFVCLLLSLFFSFSFCIKKKENGTPWSELRVKLAVLQFHPMCIEVDRGTVCFMKNKYGFIKSRAPNTTRSASVKHTHAQSENNGRAHSHYHHHQHHRLPTNISNLINNNNNNHNNKNSTTNDLILDPVAVTPPSQFIPPPQSFLKKALWYFCDLSIEIQR